MDWDGTVLSEQEVTQGGNATPPSDPSRTGYTFAGWSRSFTNIQENRVITAIYWVNENGGFIEDPPEEIEIEEEEPPLAEPDLGAWALINLILSILGVIIAIYVTVRALLKKRRDNREAGEAQSYAQMEEAERENNGKEKRYRIIWLAAVIILSIAAVVLFILTQDIRLPMIYIDWWTLAHIVLFAVELIGMFFIFKRRKDDEGQQPEEMGTQDAV